MADIPVTLAVSGPVTYEILSGRVRIVRSGSEVASVTASEAGDQYQNGGGEVALQVYNAGVAEVKVTRLASSILALADPLLAPDDVVVCPPSSETLFPPVSARLYNDAAGNVQLRYPAGTAPDLSIFAVRIPAAR